MVVRFCSPTSKAERSGAFNVHRCSVWSVSSTLAILTGMRGHLLIRDSLVTGDVKGIFVCLFVFHPSFSVKCLFKNFARLKNWFVNFLVTELEFFMF